MKHHSQAGSHRSRSAHCARLLGDRGTARRRRSDARAHTRQGGHPQRELVPLAPHGAPVRQALRLEGHDRRRVDAGLQGAAGRVRLRPRDGGRDSRASRGTGQGHDRAAPRAARSRRRPIAHPLRLAGSTGSGRRRACRTTRISPTSTARRSSRTNGRSSRRTWIARWTSPGRPAHRRRHHRHRHRERARPRRQDRQHLDGPRDGGRRRYRRQQRRCRTRHRGRLADRRKRRRRDRHGRLRRRHPRHRHPRRRRRDLHRHAGRGRTDEARLARRADRQHEPRRQDSVRADPRGRDPRAAAQGVLLIASAGNDGATSAGRRRTSSRRAAFAATASPSAQSMPRPPRVVLGLRQAPLPRRARDLRRQQRRHARRASAREPVRRPVH